MLQPKSEPPEYSGLLVKNPLCDMVEVPHGGKTSAKLIRTPYDPEQPKVGFIHTRKASLDESQAYSGRMISLANAPGDEGITYYSSSA